MYLPHEINRIKDQRRLRQRGIADPSDLGFGDAGLDYDEKSAVGAAGDAEGDDRVADEGGITIEPFHMRREMQEGAFDTEGTYVESNRKMTSTNRSLNRDEGDDPWVASLEEQNSLSFKVRYQCLYASFTCLQAENGAFYAKQPVRASASTPDLMEQLQDVPTIDVIKRLITLLEPGETPVDALKVKRQQSGKRCLPGFRKQERDAADASAASQGAESKHKKETGPKDLSKYDVSDLAHVLTITWQNVYYMTKEDIRNALAAAKNRPKRGGKSAPPTRYQFRWVRGDGVVYGPCSEVEVLSWIAHDYVSDDNPIELREVGPDGTPLDEEWVGHRDTPLYNFLNPGAELPGGVKRGRADVGGNAASDTADKVASGDNESNIATSGGGAGESNGVGGDPSTGVNEEESDDDDDDGTFAKRRRKDELIGIKPSTKKADEDSGGSDDDDEPDIE
ncbi:hypothetical protein, conserved [Babesia bigemina]|uniref:GYF domain-containing protein n=1 Tax=Babesia bigemina TaxID=5866 RepID=A0A061DEH7_BABBI|nr:hypothetical protein, conserved [Babesia bigemina]CDR97300.1 hypothetical protein, conserved [Babesia bigemina]|eukprot:XP_012769486.1 hypothetical protein, conserved [Babesia bigemina]